MQRQGDRGKFKASTAGGGEQRAGWGIDTLSDLLIIESRDTGSFMLWSLNKRFSIGRVEG